MKLNLDQGGQSHEKSGKDLNKEEEEEEEEIMNTIDSIVQSIMNTMDLELYAMLQGITMFFQFYL